MMSRLGCLVLSACLLFSGFLSAQDTPLKVTGAVKEFDIKIGRITVRPTRKGATEDETYGLLKKDIDVTTLSGEKSRLDAIVPGQVVQFKIDAAGYVDAIVVQPPVYVATIVDLDPTSRTITLARDEDKPRAMAVAADAKVWLAGRSAFLREVKLGSRMTVTATLDDKTAVGLNLVSDPDGKLATKLYPRVKTSKLPGIRYFGVLTDIDSAKSELKFSGPKTKNVPTVMPVAKDALIQVIYGQVALQSVPLNQVVKMAQATVLVSAANQQVNRVLVVPPTVRGKVKTLDGTGGLLTVDMNGSTKTFALRRDIKVMNGTRVMRLGDLQPDLSVNLVLSLDREQMLAVDMRQFD